MENQSSTPIVKSTFVTVFAWLMVVFNGFGLLVALMQNIMFAFIFQIDEFNSAFNDIGDMPKGFPTFIFKNFKWIIPVFGLFILFAFISSIGLLKRKEWARKAFLFLLGFGIIYTISASVLQIIFAKSMFSFAEMPSEFDFFSIFFIAFMIIFSLGFIFLFGWLFKKLSSVKVKEEFNLPLTDNI
jgi:hypothetical protein